MIRTVHVTRLTVSHRRFYPGQSLGRLEVRFTKSRVHCPLPDGTVLKKIKGGRGGGNYEATVGGDIYRIST